MSLDHAEVKCAGNARVSPTSRLTRCQSSQELLEDRFISVQISMNLLEAISTPCMSLEASVT